jgi:hypothetical protein
MIAADDFRAEVETWIGGKPEREALLTEKIIAESTLSAFLRGRYNPGPRLIEAMRSVMEKNPRQVAG